MKYHYVYKLTDPVTGEFYYGSRTSETMSEDDPYMGSYNCWVPQDVDRLIKTIIESDFETREDAMEFESNLIQENIDKVLNRNYHIPNKGFYNKIHPNNPFKTLQRLQRFCQTYDYQFDPERIDEIDVHEIKRKWLENRSKEPNEINIQHQSTTQKRIYKSNAIEIID